MDPLVGAFEIWAAIVGCGALVKWLFWRNAWRKPVVLVGFLMLLELGASILLLGGVMYHLHL